MTSSFHRCFAPSARAGLGFVALFFLVLAAAPLSGQTKPSGKKSDQSKSAEERSEKIEKTGRALRESKDALKRGNVVEAEAALEKLNARPPLSADWHLENANNLLRAASQTKEQGNLAGARDIAWRAMRQTEKAANLAGDDLTIKTRVSVLRQTIAEQFLASSTTSAALKNLQELESKSRAKPRKDRTQQKPGSPGSEIPEKKKAKDKDDKDDEKTKLSPAEKAVLDQNDPPAGKKKTP
ncbi:MAG: hypothetical protein NTU80_13285 [Verrucomicrobia bacterium]|nr:hypothetical protein [Verrucomicrobiota bacterium]